MNGQENVLHVDGETAKAVAHYWKTRATQRNKQEVGGRADHGFRSAVTGGAQMDGFIDLFTELITQAGIPRRYIFQKKAVELPGFFRPTKEWDLLVIRDHTLIAAIEAKSQVGPSFGNNFNNRTEEAMGSALDLWTAFREQAYLAGPQPFLGYFFMLEDCEASNRPVGVKEPLFCRKLVLERHYTSSAFITSSSQDGLEGLFKTPADDLSVNRFAKILVAHMATFL